MKIGITGGIGSGKTYICQKLAAMGYPIYNCDAEAKRLMNEQTAIRRQLTQLIGNEAYTQEGLLNTQAVARFLFGGEANAQHIADIVHPAVRRDFLAWYARRAHRLCFMESAILYESGFDSAVERTVLVEADEKTRLQRAMQRDHVSPEQIQARMARQLSTEALRARADYVLDNSIHANTAEEIAKMLNWLTVKE